MRRKEVMSMSGRRAKPMSVQEMEGNPGKLSKQEIEERRAAEERIKPNADKVEPPDWLGDVAREEFNKLASELMQIGLITNPDVNSLAVYCDALEKYIECTRQIKADGIMMKHVNNDGHENKIPHPLLSKQRDAANTMKAIAQEFGMTPSARAKLAIPRDNKKEPTEFDREFGDV